MKIIGVMQEINRGVSFGIQLLQYSVFHFLYVFLLWLCSNYNYIGHNTTHLHRSAVHVAAITRHPLHYRCRTMSTIVIVVTNKIIITGDLPSPFRSKAYTHFTVPHRVEG